MVTANELKTKGIQALEKEIKNNGQAIITHRGKSKYVVIDIEEFDNYLAYKLDLDYQKVLKEIEKGDFKELSNINDISKHIDSL